MVLAAGALAAGIATAATLLGFDIRRAAAGLPVPRGSGSVVQPPEQR